MHCHWQSRPIKYAGKMQGPLRGDGFAKVVAERLRTKEGEAFIPMFACLFFLLCNPTCSFMLHSQLSFAPGNVPSANLFNNAAKRMQRHELTIFSRGAVLNTILRPQSS
jgi:hypothetical protein